MTTVRLGLLSEEGDRLGHLVRGVQMLGSYGKEFRAYGFTDVREAGDHHPPALVTRLEAETDSAEDRFAAILREAEWALGNLGLSLYVLQWGDRTATDVQPEFEAEGRLYMKAEEFREICGWGQ